MSLADEVKNVKDTKHKLLQEKEFLSLEKQRVLSKYNQLNRHLLQVSKMHCRSSISDDDLQTMIFKVRRH